MNNFDFDVIVIGGGPGGYNCAIRASQLGFKVACIEKDKLGGTCLNVGCIPSKALLESSSKYKMINDGWLNKFGLSVNGIQADISKVMETKNKIVSELNGGVGMLLSSNGVTSISGSASFENKNTINVILSNNETKKITSKYFVIATGSIVSSLPNVSIDEKIVISSNSGVNLTETPKEMIVIGGGVIGLELGSVWARFGAKVTVLEYLDRIAATMDEDISSELLKSLKKDGLNFNLGVSVTKVENCEDHGVVYYKNNSDGKEFSMKADKILISVGRKPNTAGLNLDKIGVTLTNRGFVQTNKLQTSINNIYAIGDVTEGPMLAHKAEEDGVIAAELIAGQKPELHYDIIPSVIYTHPEGAGIGKTEKQLKDEGIQYLVGKVSFAGNGRAKTMRETDGFVKILSDNENNRILGMHIVHAQAGSLINECSVYMAYGASPDDIALTVHSHPDLNETIRGAALDVLGRPMASLPKKKK
jgi:dihydrolipoamide dehydrogenase